MIRNYLRTTLRFLSRNKTFSFINILGLTLGTLCCLYIVMYVTDQKSYDLHHRDHESIYRVNRWVTSIDEGSKTNIATTVGPVATLMKQDLPEVEEFTRVVPFPGVVQHLVRYGDRSLYEKDAVYVDSTFFQLFSYHFVRGNKNALLAPNSVVLAKGLADKLFSGEDPAGKVIRLDNTFISQDLTVTGVVDESAGKSHLQSSIFITMNSGGPGDYVLHTDSWIRNGYISSYVRLRPGTDPSQVDQKLALLVAKYGAQQLKSAGVENKLYLQPVHSIHTTTGLGGFQFSQPVSSSFLNLLMVIALLIQVIACINFMNLSTARASKRAKEVGVRKVIGARQKQLVRQFLGESLLLSLLAVLIAVPLLLLLLPYLNKITSADVPLSLWLDYRLWLLLTGIVVVTGLLAGSYPAFYLSNFMAVRVLKGNLTNHISAAGIRRSLVVFQFVLSIVLISGIIVVYSQINFIRNKDLGFDKEQRLIFNFYTEETVKHIPAFMNGLREVAGVQEVSNASKFLSSPAFFSNGFFLRHQQDAESKTASFIITDEHFIKANGIRLVSGRNFIPSDSAKVLINETFARQLGLDPLSAPGTLVYDNQSRVEEVIGVMKDFNFNSLHKSVEGFLLWKTQKVENAWPTVIAHVSSSNYEKTIADIAAVWRKTQPDTPFAYSFLDEEVAKQYEAEITIGRIINSFTLMAILISCLGLFGLAAFSAEQRAKEIGVRKVLGAGTGVIVGLLSKDFLKLIIVAFAIATPVAWWAMDQWLQNFAYRVPISWWMFGLAGSAAMIIAFSTVCFQAVRAAVENPVKSLRSE